MRKSDLACSLTMAGVLSAVPEEAEIDSVVVFVGIKGGGVFMGSRISANPEEVASMISAFGEAKRSIIEGIIRDYGMEALVTIMFYLASNHAGAEELGGESEEELRRFFVPGQGRKQ